MQFTSGSPHNGLAADSQSALFDFRGDAVKLSLYKPDGFHQIHVYTSWTGRKRRKMHTSFSAFSNETIKYSDVDFSFLYICLGTIVETCNFLMVFITIVKIFLGFIS